jgi:hypothetical protein
MPNDCARIAGAVQGLQKLLPSGLSGNSLAAVPVSLAALSLGASAVHRTTAMDLKSFRPSYLTSMVLRKNAI